MSARIGVWQAKWSRAWCWQCDDSDDPGMECPAKRSCGIEFSLAAAADAGRDHLRECHAPIPIEDMAGIYADLLAPQSGYSRACGVSLAACEARECRCVSVDPEGEFGPQKPAARAFQPCDRPDCPICTTRNALQTTHNESRGGC